MSPKKLKSVPKLRIKLAVPLKAKNQPRMIDEERKVKKKVKQAVATTSKVTKKSTKRRSANVSVDKEILQRRSTEQLKQSVVNLAAVKQR